MAKAKKLKLQKSPNTTTLTTLAARWKPDLPTNRRSMNPTMNASMNMPTTSTLTPATTTLTSIICLMTPKKPTTDEIDLRPDDGTPRVLAFQSPEQLKSLRQTAEQDASAVIAS